VVKESRSPVSEDRAAREARRLLAAQKKEEQDAAKKRQVQKTLKHEALKKRRHQQSLEGLPIEESPSEMVSGEDEDSGDDDAGSWYDTVTFLAHLPDVRPLLEPIGGVDLQNFSRLRWSRLPTTRACEPKLGMSACVNELIFVTFVVMASGALKHLDVSLY
jgi:hypothetical protein